MRCSAGAATWTSVRYGQARIGGRGQKDVVLPSWWPFRRCGPLVTAARATPRLFEELGLGVARRDRHGRRVVVAGGAPDVGAFFGRGDPQLPFSARLAALGRPVLPLPVPDLDRQGRRVVVAGGAPDVGAFFGRGDPQLPFSARLAALGRPVLHLPVPDPTRALPRL